MKSILPDSSEKKKNQKRNGSEKKMPTKEWIAMRQLRKPTVRWHSSTWQRTSSFDSRG